MAGARLPVDGIGSRVWRITVFTARWVPVWLQPALGSFCRRAPENVHQPRVRTLCSMLRQLRDRRICLFAEIQQMDSCLYSDTAAAGSRDFNSRAGWRRSNGTDAAAAEEYFPVDDRIRAAFQVPRALGQIQRC